ncbi:MAG: TolC family protein, partial [Rhodothermales bacterium]|nr:TolC family protein [Rhodothermales bacterium]
MPRSSIALLLLTLLAVPARAQELPAAVRTAEATGEAIPLTLDDALEIALARNYAVRTAALDVANADAQVREAWGQLFPQVDASASYTRNVVSANPFAGSSAGGLFGSLAAIDWLAFNERARTDEDPGTDPITLAEFQQRQAAGFAEAGVELGGGDNPFSVPNQFLGQVEISQTLYNGSAFAAVKGANSLREINEAALTQQQQEVVHETRELY